MVISLLFPDCVQSGDVIFMLDSSGSVGKRDFITTKHFLKDMVQDLNVDDGLVRIGLLTYGTEAAIQFHLNTYGTRADIMTAIDAVPYTAGTTNTAEALRVLQEQMFTAGNGSRSDRNNVTVLFTDGGSNNFAETLMRAREAKAAGISILVVAITNWVNMLEVREIATDADDINVFTVDSVDNIWNLTSRLRRGICNGKDSETKIHISD